MADFKFYQEEDTVYIRLRPLPYDHGHNLDDNRGIDYVADNQPIGSMFLVLRSSLVQIKR